MTGHGYLFGEEIRLPIGRKTCQRHEHVLY